MPAPARQCASSREAMRSERRTCLRAPAKQTPRRPAATRTAAVAPSLALDVLKRVLGAPIANRRRAVGEHTAANLPKQIITAARGYALRLGFTILRVTPRLDIRLIFAYPCVQGHCGFCSSTFEELGRLRRCMRPALFSLSHQSA